MTEQDEAGQCIVGHTVAAHVGAWTGIGWHDVACQSAAGYGALWPVMAGLARSPPCRAIGCHGLTCGAIAS
jgi:hypothetical protein